jgi:hypothetical protein
MPTGLSNGPPGIHHQHQITRACSSLKVQTYGRRVSVPFFVRPSGCPKLAATEASYRPPDASASALIAP